MSRWIHRPRHSTVVAYLALVVTVGSGTAYAASAGYVRLGHTNTENGGTTLQRATPGTALNLRVGNGYPGFTVNTKTRIRNLNADLIDGKDSSSLQPKIAALKFATFTLLNGWTPYSGSYAPGIVTAVDGVIRFHGAMSSGTGSPAFMLPAKFRPAHITYLVVDECNGSTGRITLYPTGEAYVSGDPATTYANSAACFTSLDGVSYTR